MGLWGRKGKQDKPYSASLDAIYQKPTIPPLKVEIATVRTRSYHHLDSVKTKSANLFRFADESFQHICSLGSGAYSTISKVYHRPTKTIMAKKIMPIDECENETREETETRILRELNILARCQCPYIVNYYGTYISDHRICIMMEYMDVGSLEFIYKRLGSIPANPMKTITLHSVRGLLYLEEQDIKPANILLNSSGETKLADFGLSKELYGSLPKSCVGTIAYLAPENLEKRMGCDTIITHKSDVWSLGMTLLECALGRFPHETDGLFEENASSLFELLSTSESLGKEFLEFCSLCLTKNQTARTSSRELAETDYVLDTISNPFDLMEWLENEKLIPNTPSSDIPKLKK